MAYSLCFVAYQHDLRLTTPLDDSFDESMHCDDREAHVVARAVTTYKARAAEHLRSCQHMILKLLGENESAFQPRIQRASSSRDQHLN